MKQHYIAANNRSASSKRCSPANSPCSWAWMEVQAPILSRVGDGTQDNLSGHENAVQVKVKTLPQHSYAEVVHSAAGKEAPDPGSLRFRPGRRHLHPHEGAASGRGSPHPHPLRLRGPVGLGEGDAERAPGSAYLQETVRGIWSAIKATERAVCAEHALTPLPAGRDPVLHSEELLTRYPDPTPRARARIAKELGRRLPHRYRRCPVPR